VPKKFLGYNVRVKAEEVDYSIFKEYVEIAKRADNCYDYGLCYLAIPEFFARRDPARLHCIPYMGAIANATEHVKFGPHVLEVPLFHPKHVADIGASLDIMSNGRFILGVGVGFQPYEYEVFGVPWEERGKRLDESLEIMKKFWTAPKDTLVTHEGRYFKIKDECSPPCVQKPHLPIWVGGGSEAALRRTAQYGNEWTPGWVFPGQAEESQLIALGKKWDAKKVHGLQKGWSWEWALEKLEEYCGKFGRELVIGRPPEDPKEVGFNMTFNFNINPDREKAVEELRHFWVDVRKARTQGGGSLEMKLKYSAVGNAEDVIEKIDEAYKLGAYMVILYPLSTNSKAQWERVEKEVLPSL